MCGSENPSEYCSDSENEGIDCSSEWIRKWISERVFPRDEGRAYQYEPLKNNCNSENHLAEEEKGNGIVVSQSKDHRIGHIRWCSCRNCWEKSRKVDWLC